MRRETEGSILIFDVGKTHKKVLMFDRDLALLHEEEHTFEEVADEEGFPCEDAGRLEEWIRQTTYRFVRSDRFPVRGLNFATYGATLVYLDRQGQRIAPIYNYLKPMSESLSRQFYAAHGGKVEFCRKTASPALGMLNSGLQLFWLKRNRPGIFQRAAHVLHLPQYLSYLITGKVASEHTSIGCHTGMWDFDAMRYHDWLQQEGITLPEPLPVSESFRVRMNGRSLRAGIGIHDSSSSLVPYMKTGEDPFILVSTGTWCISMNPFNHEPLTGEELKEDCLCYLGVNRKPVKSSRLFLGRIHDLNVERLESHFRVRPGHHRELVPEMREIRTIWEEGQGRTLFFRHGIPSDYLERETLPGQFPTFGEAYARFMLDCTKLAVSSVKRVIPARDNTRRLYITGGFARNLYFTGFMSLFFPSKEVYTSSIHNSTSLGAALVIAGNVFPGKVPEVDLGLQKINENHQ